MKRLWIVCENLTKRTDITTKEQNQVIAHHFYSYIVSNGHKQLGLATEQALIKRHLKRLAAAQNHERNQNLLHRDTTVLERGVVQLHILVVVVGIGKEIVLACKDVG